MKDRKKERKIKIGQLSVVLPSVLIWAGILTFSLNFEQFFSKLLDLHGLWYFVIFILGNLLGIVMAWFYWSIAAPRWRYWALQNTNKRDWQYILERATASYILHPPGHPFENTEFRNQQHKRQLAEFYVLLQRKEKREKMTGSYEDDPEIKGETKFYPKN